jgi:hypothetical protein
MSELRNGAPGLRAWAGRLACALREDDGDAFIAAYDSLLADPAAYSDDQVEAVKDMARALFDSGQYDSVDGTPALDGVGAATTAPSEPAAPSPPALQGTPGKRADGRSGAQHAGKHDSTSSSVRAANESRRPQPVSTRTIGVQAELWESPPSLERDAVMLMLRERWLQGMGLR